MAFADVILTESDATMIIIDRYAKPGGHWNLAYPFVHLHQPSSFYGVSSKELSGGRIEQSGLNKGLGELASGAEVSAYFDDVMRHQFLASGRVQYFPMCNYEGGGKFRSKVSGTVYEARANKKIVDATHLTTHVPSTHTPNFEIAPDVRFMPLNDLPEVTESPDGFVVIGAGKTGVDACLWLLEQRIDPAKITWIMPRDAWYLDRRNTQMQDAFFFDTIGAAAGQFESIANAASVEDMFDRLERCGYFVRLDPNVRPAMFHGATISQAELKVLRTLPNIIRMGRVKSISAAEIILDDGEIPTTLNTIHVDCSASALREVIDKPIFEEGLITPQMVRAYQPVFSAALAAHVELNYETDTEKNALCGVVPLPDGEIEYMKFTLAALMNQRAWRENKALQKWIAGNRLDGPSKLLLSVTPDDTEKMAVLDRLRTNAPLAAMKLFELIAAAEEGGAG